MKILVAPDKFKGSLTSFEACDAIYAGIRKANNNATIQKLPMADGGDGFASVLQYYLSTDTIYCDTVDPLGRNIQASYQWEKSVNTAIIEMAVASGLSLLTDKERNPMRASVFGTGLMIKNAIEKGAETIILGLGGSATNDGGTGILSALGFRLLNDTGEVLQASGENLLHIRRIDPPLPVPAVKFEIACDVQNIMYGPHGAAYIYAPQKGADKTQVEILDRGLKNFANVLKEQTGRDPSNISGSGAAGGIAAGLLAYFDVTMKKGIEMITGAAEIEKRSPGADLLITGEGKIDDQSREGKVVGYIASLAKKYNVPCIGLCGTTELDDRGIKQLGLAKIITLSNQNISKEEAIQRAAEILEEKAKTILDFL